MGQSGTAAVHKTRDSTRPQSSLESRLWAHTIGDTFLDEILDWSQAMPTEAVGKQCHVYNL